MARGSKKVFLGSKDQQETAAKGQELASRRRGLHRSNPWGGQDSRQPGQELLPWESWSRVSLLDKDIFGVLKEKKIFCL